VIELACNGKLKASKEGRFWRFNEADVMRYRKEQDRVGVAPS
jgi:hypothetical protein